MNVKVIGIAALLLVLCAVMSIWVPESFLTGNNVENLLRRTALYGVLGIGVAFVIVTAGIDLSIGSIVCLSGCLLSLFLSVAYEPFAKQAVLDVRPGARAIILAGRTDAYQAGDRIRYYGGRRAPSTLVTVRRVSPTTFAGGGREIDATELLVDGLKGHDDDRGSVTQVWAVLRFEAGAPGDPDNRPRVVIAGAHGQLRPRDQIILVHPDSGLKRLRIARAEVKGDETELHFADDLGAITTEWVAQPLQRRQRMPVPVALLSILAIGLLLGLVHGVLVTKLKLQPFVVTLCGLLFYRGISRWLVNDQTVGLGNEYEATLAPLATGKFVLWTGADGTTFGIPYPFFILVATAVLAAVFLNKTIWGRYMLALGRNEDAARYSGIDTDRMTIIAYIICTVLGVTGGILFAVDSNSVQPSSFGNFFELYAIAAAVLGGCSLRGGEGGILGVVIGTAVMQTLYNLIVLMKISDTLEFAIIGLVILLGVIADELIQRFVAKRRAIPGSAIALTDGPAASAGDAETEKTPPPGGSVPRTDS